MIRHLKRAAIIGLTLTVLAAPAFAQTATQHPASPQTRTTGGGADMPCPGDKVVWVNTKSGSITSRANAGSAPRSRANTCASMPPTPKATARPTTGSRAWRYRLINRRTPATTSPHQGRRASPSLCLRRNQHHQAGREIVLSIGPGFLSNCRWHRRAAGCRRAPGGGFPAHSPGSSSQRPLLPALRLS